PAAPDVGSLLPDNGAAPPVAQDCGLAHWHGRTDVSAWAGTTVWHGERIDWDWALDWFCNQPGAGEGRKEGGEHARAGNAAIR
ncbi:MAG: hypothetical protein OXU74_01350, partial [Gemmatimonadota bacterium]|nr:hypothetical protein [Gemmatimonadota bacterium]